MSDKSLGAAVVTGASSGIGAVYADRLAKRGYDLVLVARNEARLRDIAARLSRETDVKVEVLQADLANAGDLRRVEARLKSDPSITLLVNNAGIAVPGSFAEADLDKVEELIAINITALARLSGAAIPGLIARKGSLINIASVLALAPEVMPGAYPATKAFVLTFSQGLQSELGDKLYVQAVLPAATRTEIWARSGMDLSKMSGVMDVQELVDAALVGFDRRELVTIPPLPDAAQFEAFEAARQTMMANFRQEHAAARYRA